MESDSEQRKHAREVFSGIVDTLGAALMQSALQAAEAEVTAGNEGIIFSDASGEDGLQPDIEVAIRGDLVDFRHGNLGPYVLSLVEVNDLLPDTPQS